MKLSKPQKDLLKLVFQDYFAKGLVPEEDVICLGGPDYGEITRELVHKGIFIQVSSDTDLIVIKVAPNLPKWIEDLKIMSALIR